MRKIWEVAWLYLYQSYKDRSTLLYGFALPLIFTAVIGAGMSGVGGGGDAQTAWRLDIVNLDGGAMSTYLIEELQADTAIDVDEVDEATATADLEAGEATGMLVVPVGFSAQLESGETLTLELKSSRENPTDAQIVEQAVRTALTQVSSAVQIAETSVRVAETIGLFDVAGAPSREAYYQDALQAGHEADPLARVETVQVTRREQDAEAAVPSGFQQTSPGIGVMFTMFFITYGGASLLLEREQGTLRRLLTMPISKAAIMAGKILGVFIAGAIQFSILVLAGQFFFGVDWGGQPLALVIMIVAFVFCITSFGIMLAALVRTYAQIDALSMLIIMPLAGLGGAMWPLEIVPAWMQQLSGFLPTGLAMRGFQDLISRGLGTADILFEAGSLAAFGLVFLLIGVWRFRYE